MVEDKNSSDEDNAEYGRAGSEPEGNAGSSPEGAERGGVPHDAEPEVVRESESEDNDGQQQATQEQGEGEPERGVEPGDLDDPGEGPSRRTGTEPFEEQEVIREFTDGHGDPDVLGRSSQISPQANKSLPLVVQQNQTQPQRRKECSTIDLDDPRIEWMFQQ